MTTTTSRTTSPAASPSLRIGITACIFLSGFAALLYQVAWFRQFSSVIGTSELAVVTVLAAYLAGLSGGAAIAARYVTRIARPIWTYGLIEAGIAVSALAVPLILAGIGMLYVWMLGDQPAPPNAAEWGQPIFYLAVAAGILAVPTALMGATLPLLTRALVHAEPQIGPRVALLYATNTLGAACGALTAGFVLLPAFGLNLTVVTGAVVNLAIFGFVATMSRRLWAPAVERTPRVAPSQTNDAPGTSFYRACVRPLLLRTAVDHPRGSTVFRSQPAWILPIMLLSGANAFIYEVLWTRMLTHVLGGSVYAFATMLAAFLGGLALGGGLSGGFAHDRERAASAFVLLQAAVGVLSILVYTLLGPLMPDSPSMLTLSGYAVGIMLPATIFLGASFPLAVRTLATQAERAGAVTAQVYAWNTAGAILGAVLAGFVLIPSLGFEGTIRLAVSVNFGLALWAALCVAKRRAVTVGFTATGLLVTLFVYSPSRPEAMISSTGFPLAYNIDPEEVFYAVGRSATVLLLEENGVYFLRANGLPEASILAKGSPPQQDPAKWLTALPVTARPEAQSMLLIGFGGGVALEGVPPSIRSVDVIELEPEIINANSAFADRRNGDPLQDPRINIIINDARSALRLTSKRYDVIVSQPSHPWTSGAAPLYTREFLAEAKGHLSNGGVLVQWINSEFVDAPLLRSLAATLLSEFDNVRLYRPESQVLVFLASDAELEPELALSRSGEPLTDDVMHYSRMGLNGVEDLIAALAMDGPGVADFAADAPISTDDNLLLATRSRTRADGLLGPELGALFAPHDPLLKRSSWVYTRLTDRVDFGYITRRLIQLGERSRALAAAEIHPDESTRLLMAGLLYADRGQRTEATAAIRAALDRRPDNAQARYLLIKPSIGQLAQGSATAEVTELAAALPSSAAAVIQGWRAAGEQDWESLAQLDGVLGLTSVTDAWYPDVVRLRAEWRGKVTLNVENIAFDAQRLIDRALVIEPSLNLLLLRAGVGITTKDAGVAIESSRQIVRNTRATLEQLSVGDGRIAQRELMAIRQNLTAITTSLRGTLVAGNERHAEQVRQAANDILRYLDAAASPVQQ